MGIFNLSALPLISIFILLSVAVMLYLRLRKYKFALKEIAEFAEAFLAGNFKKIYLADDSLNPVAVSLNSMASEIRSRLNDLAEERNKTEAILKSMTEGILITDIKARVMLVNPAAMKLLSMNSGMTGETVIVATRIAELQRMVLETINRGEVLVGEVYIKYPEGLHLMATAVPLYSHAVPENISGAVLSLHDITRLKKLEEVRKTFVANVSHEMKTPITAIKGFAETLLDGALNDRSYALKFLETIRAHSERINNLVDDLLTISRIELGDLRIEKQEVDLGGIIDTVFTTLMDKAKVKGLYLKKALPAGPVYVSADRDRLIQIFLNLVENGIKFSEHGGITVGLDNVDGRSSLFVHDTGMGVPKSHISRLGERFYRVDSARSRELGGTGLGLAIVKHLVKAHGWDMEIESVHGKETTVRLLM